MSVHVKHRSAHARRPSSSVSSSARLALWSAILALPATFASAQTSPAVLAPSDPATAPTATPAPAPRSSGEQVVLLDKVEVTEKRDLATADLASAQLKLAEVPGTTSVVNLADVERGRAANAEDMLAFQPGVYAQATSGASANKISIRGSGLNTFYQGYSLGTKYLYDGQPITGPGGTQEELLAVASTSYIEILNGPNAFTYASTSFGGAINFVTHTGYTAPGFEAKIEVGGFGYRRDEVSYGGVSGKTDYYVSVVQNERDGMQINTPIEGNTIVANLGQRINDRLDTRLIFRFVREEVHNGSTLTKQQIEDDPSQNNTVGLAQPPLVVPGGTLLRGAQSARKKQGSTVIASKTAYVFDDDSKLEVGLSNTNYPLENGWLYSTTPQDWRSNDVNATLRYLREDELFGRTSKTTAIFSDTRLVFGDVHGYRDLRNGTPRTLTQYTEFSGSADTVVAVGNDLELVDKHLWLTAGLSYAEIARDIKIVSTTLTTPNPAGYPREVDSNDGYLLPRLGLRYQVNPAVQVFGSVSEAVDGPVTWQMGSTGTPFIKTLVPQEATTTEVGVRAKGRIFDGSLTLYRAWLDKELLSVTDPNLPAGSPNAVTNTNASPTIHQGIELGLNALLWSDDAGNEKSTNLSLRQSYTFNDFYFENDADWGDNQLPSIPLHVYQVELLFQHRQGFYAGVNVRAASDYYVDFANTVKADPYAILGAKIGYETPRWSVFLDLRNITDEHYATAANTVANANGIESTAANFYAGDTFNAIAGVSVRF